MWGAFQLQMLSECAARLASSRYFEPRTPYAPMTLHTYHIGETLAGVSERRLQALISKRGGRGNRAKAELEASFKAVRDAVVCC